MRAETEMPVRVMRSVGDRAGRGDEGSLSPSTRHVVPFAGMHGALQLFLMYILPSTEMNVKLF